MVLAVLTANVAMHENLFIKDIGQFRDAYLGREKGASVLDA